MCSIYSSTMEKGNKIEPSFFSFLRVCRQIGYHSDVRSQSDDSLRAGKVATLTKQKRQKILGAMKRICAVAP